MPYRHFSIEEREALSSMTLLGLGKDESSRIIGKHVSSIYRELSRNAESGCYLPRSADERARIRRQESKTSPVLGNIRLMKSVDRLLREKVAPDQVSGRIRLERKGKDGWHISIETIYKHIYDEADKGNDLRPHLRHPRKARRKRTASKDRRGTIPNRTFIDERPAIVERKRRRGDWEGDTIEGARKKGYVVTFVDRKSKFLVAYKIDHKSTWELVRGARKAFQKIPRKYRKTVTVDNGKEFAAHSALSEVLGAKVFFAHPYHSWERGLNEHTNGLIRQYLPKNRELIDLEPQELAQIVEALNNRPRKALGYRTPREVFFNLSLALQT